MPVIYRRNIIKCLLLLEHQRPGRSKEKYFSALSNVCCVVMKRLAKILEESKVVLALSLRLRSLAVTVKKPTGEAVPLVVI